jgi:hypothetical protein
MNDLSNTITSYLTVRDLIRDNTEDPKVLDMAVELLEYFIDKQDKAFEKAWDVVVKTPVDDIEPCMPPWGHSDLEYQSAQATIQDLKHDALYSDDPAYTENDKDQIYKNYRAAIDEYNGLHMKHEDLVTEYDRLLLDYEQLQDLFYKVDSEHDELKVKYDECQKNYHIVVSEMKHCVEELNQ